MKLVVSFNASYKVRDAGLFNYLVTQLPGLPVDLLDQLAG
ncbi:hypothetical protein ES705_32241 [subsurface metagenome]